MNDNVATPKWLFQHFEEWFDPIPLNNGKLREFDGLSDWRDRTFCNIPYSKPMKWCEKAVNESKKGKRIVLMTRVDTSTKWWFYLIENGFTPTYFPKRIKFSGKGSPNFASALWFSPEKREGGKQE